MCDHQSSRDLPGRRPIVTEASGAALPQLQTYDEEVPSVHSKQGPFRRVRVEIEEESLCHAAVDLMITSENGYAGPCVIAYGELRNSKFFFCINEKEEV